MYPYPEIDPDELLGLARSLQRVSLAGQTQPLLKGRELAVLRGPDAAQTTLFESAATELGAHVASVSLNLAQDGSGQAWERSTRLLHKLYDAIECEGLDSRAVRQLRETCALPVFDALAEPTHPTAALAAQLDASSPLDDRRRFVVQAALVWACQDAAGPGRNGPTPAGIGRSR